MIQDNFALCCLVFRGATQTPRASLMDHKWGERQDLHIPEMEIAYMERLCEEQETHQYTTLGKVC